ncbi:MAG: GntR family transcriptional regulator [Chloroflexi bacterium]|nr:GntR family transcriptional regulator [Chloroflexota bacterium]
MTGEGTTTRPIYRQVAEQIAEEIEAGILPADSRISSERELAERYGISRMTARAAINILVQRGLIVRRNRSRAYVAQPKFRFDLSSPGGLHEQLRKANVRPGARIIIAEKLPFDAVDRQVVQSLGLAEEDEIYHIVRLRTANDEPIALEDSYFPAKLFPDLLDFNLTDSIYGILRKYFSVEPAGSVQELEISLLDAEWAEIMGVAVDLPTLEIRRCAVTADNTPFEYAHDIYRGDRIIFTARTVGTENLFSGSGQLWQQALDNLQSETA